MAKKRGLPTTSYTVLGLLSLGDEMSGYEIRKWARNMRFFYWSPAQSQVYLELDRLHERGLVTAREVPQEGKPDKKLYRINHEGRAELQRWLAAGHTDPVVMKHSVLLKLYFGHMGDHETLTRLLTEYVAEVRTQQGELAVVQEFMENEPGFEYPALAAEWGYRHLETDAQMAQELIDRLSSSPGEEA